MKTIKLTENKIKNLKKNTLDHFPRYTTYIINRASETAQATRPKVVGQLTEMYKDFLEEVEKGQRKNDLEAWKAYHREQCPEAIERATEKAWAMMLNFKEAIDKIDKPLVREWVEDLVYDKTYYGLDNENLIKLYFIDQGLTVEPASEEDESRNIDAYINGRPYQVKPDSHKKESNIADRIAIPIIYYHAEPGEPLLIEIDDPELIDALNK